MLTINDHEKIAKAFGEFAQEMRIARTPRNKMWSTMMTKSYHWLQDNYPQLDAQLFDRDYEDRVVLSLSYWDGSDPDFGERYLAHAIIPQRKAIHIDHTTEAA